MHYQLRGIDRRISSADVQHLKAYQDRLEAVEDRVTGLRVPVTYASLIYALKAHINSVLNRV